MNNADRLQQVESLFHDALARPSGERAAFLEAACGADAALLSHVQALLAAHERSGNFIDQPAAGLIDSALMPDANVLLVGRQLGVYQVLALLGRGGMGEVYRARDGRLSREVAVKVLPAEFAHDAGRLRRFELEARAAGMLNHPNIVTIFDFGVHDGAPYIVAELLEGETLRERLKQGALPPAQALHYGLQIARGLQAAHGKGIVHRDLKPENLFLTRDDRVKILDFGLAKLHPPKWREAGAATRPSLPQTTPGMVLGTVGYMSPEQVREREADSRADIFVFGAVLYEMLTGQQAFQGESAAEMMSAILKEDPPELALSAAKIHPALEQVLRRCLQKAPEARFQSASDLAFNLELVAGLLSGHNRTTDKLSAEREKRVAARSGKRRVLHAGLVGALIVLLVSAAWWQSRRTMPPAPDPKENLTRLVADSGLTTGPALSTNGKMLVYASDRAGYGNLDLWLRYLASGEAVRLTRDEANDYEPSFSPDGSQIVFRSDRAGGGIYVVSATGDGERLLSPRGRRPRFSPNGREVVYWIEPEGTRPDGAWQLFVVAVAGGTPRQVCSEFATARFPVWSPDGTQILFAGRRTATEGLDWWVVPVRGGPAVKTGVSAAAAAAGLADVESPDQWAAEGNRVFFSARSAGKVNIWQIPLASNWQAARAPQRLTFGDGTERQPAVAADQLAFLKSNESVTIWSLPLAANEGRPTGPPQRLVHTARAALSPDVSLDGNLLAYFLSKRDAGPETGGFGKGDLWVKDLRSGAEMGLAASPDNERHAAVSADGTQLLYDVEVKEGGYTIRAVAARGGPVRELAKTEERLFDWSPDGKTILYRPAQVRQIGLLDVASGRTGIFLEHPLRGLYQAHFSPDGRWIAFFAQITLEVRHLYLVPFPVASMHDHTPQNEREWILISDGFLDDKPRFSPDGNLLYYNSGRDGFYCLWAQRLDATTKRPLGAPLPVYHFHSPRLSMADVHSSYQEVSVARDRLVFNAQERTDEIWLAKLTGGGLPLR